MDGFVLTRRIGTKSQSVKVTVPWITTCVQLFTTSKHEINASTHVYILCDSATLVTLAGQCARACLACHSNAYNAKGTHKRHTYIL